MMQLISVFDRSNWDITVASAAKEGNHCVDFAPYGVQKRKINVNDSGFGQFIRSLEPDAVIFDRFITEEQFGWRVAEHCPRALRILDTEDLHCLRRCRKRVLHDEQPFAERMLLDDKTALREIASIYRSDLSLIISEYEMNLLTNIFEVDKALLHYLPFLLDSVDAAMVKKPPFEERTGFMMIGNFRHPPNWDTVRYLRSSVWPLIREKLPEVRLHLYGAYPSQKVWQLHSPAKGFIIEGRAEEAEAVIKKHRAMLAPIRFGAGLKGKLLEAMQNGTPSITTSVGAEGIAGSLPWNGSIAERPEDLASAAFELYANRDKWQEAQRRGTDIINNRFAKGLFVSDFWQRMQTLQGSLSEHRKHNFIGTMLRHHNHKSTKYMAKWIEEKNGG